MTLNKQTIQTTLDIVLFENINNIRKFKRDLIQNMLSTSNIEYSLATEYQLKKFKHINNIFDSEYKTYLMYASEHGNLSLVAKILEMCNYTDHKDIYGYTALIYSCKNDHFKVSKLLLEKGAKVNIEDDYGWSALTHTSRFSGNIKKLLIFYGATSEDAGEYEWINYK